MLKLHDLFKVYRTDDVETVALSGVNVEINQGDFVAVMGPSGCGKSTLLNIIGMLDSPSDGSYFFLDEDVSGYGEAQLSAIRKKNIGFIFQSFNLIDELTVAENIELALLYHDMAASERTRRVKDVMDRIGIAHRAGHMPGQLSGGQQQRVAVARAIVGDQPLILADEPTAISIPCMAWKSWTCSGPCIPRGRPLSWSLTRRRTQITLSARSTYSMAMS